MRRIPARCSWLALLGFMLTLLSAAPASAYVWMIKHGFSKCGTCHTDPSGGATLTLMGRAQARDLLSWNGERTPPRTARFLVGAVPEPDPVRLGGSYRHMLIYTAVGDGSESDLSQFPMQLDVYGSGTFDLFIVGGSLGVARGIDGSAHVRGAQLNRELEDGWLLLSRSHFIGLRLDDAALLRLGRLNLPFGLRIPEHVMWAREATRTDRESDQQHGLALAYSGARLRLEAMAIVGNFQLYPDRYRERGYSLFTEYALSGSIAVGASSLLTRANEDRFTQSRRAVRHAQAVHARAGLSAQWSLWGELALLEEGGRGSGHTGFLQVDYEPLRGLHLTATGELLDRGELDSRPEAPGSGETLLGAWLSASWYVYSHAELRFDLLKRQESPLSAQLQLHLFL